MSGSIASRFQTRFGYGPTLRAGVYPGMAPAVPVNMPAIPTAPATPAPQPVTAAPVAAAPSLPAAAAAPVYAGSIRERAEGSNASGGDGYGGAIGSNADGSVFGLGSNPGSFGGGLSGFGVGLNTYGTLGGVLGGLAGMATGVPGLGIAGSALGTYADVRGANSMLTDYGLAPTVDWAPAFANNMTFGLAGQSVDAQMSQVSPLGSTWGPYAGVDPELSQMAMQGVPAPQIAPQAIAPEAVASQPTATEGPSPMSSFDWSQVSFAAPTGDDFDANAYAASQPAVDFAAEASFAGWGNDYGAGWGSNFSDGGGSFGSAGSDFGGADASDSPGGDGDGWMRGGYTGHGGDGMVQPHEPAGTVHEGEVVIPAAQVARYGLPALMALVNGDVPPSRLAALARG